MHIAVGLDLDLDGYDWLLGRAVCFAECTRARLDLVYVGKSEKLPRLEALLSSVPEDLRGTTRLLQGDPEDQLVAISRHYDLLVVGPREPQGLERLLRSAMAIRVLRRSACPVYVPRTDKKPLGPVRLGVGVDLDSDKLGFVLREVNRLALRLGGTVDLLHAVPGALTSSRRPELNATLEREWAATQKAVVARLMGLLEDLHPDVRGQVQVSDGEAADSLVEASERYDLIVVGNRDHTGFERFLLGGVARTVVVQSACDVLVLPTEAAPA